MNFSRDGQKSATSMILVFATLLVSSFLVEQARALSTFMTVVGPALADCYFVNLQENDKMNLSMIVEHDDKSLKYHNKVDILVYDSANKLVKSLHNVEYADFDYSATTSGYHLYCYINRHQNTEAAVSFSIWSPDEEQIYKETSDELLKSPEGKDFKAEPLSDLAKLEDSIKYLVYKASFLRRKSVKHIERLKVMRRSIVYWKVVQMVATICFAFFQIACTKRFINSRRRF